MYKISSVSNPNPVQISGTNTKCKVAEFKLLKSNWDGYGGIPLIEEIGNHADNLITTMSDVYIDHISDVFPNPNGTITIEWENKKDEKLSLEIGLHNYSIFIKYKDKDPKFINGESIITDKEIFTKALSELLSESIFTPIL
jgi:hypothetical protein